MPGQGKFTLNFGLNWMEQMVGGTPEEGARRTKWSDGAAA